MPDDLHKYNPDYVLQRMLKRLINERDELTTVIDRWREDLDLKERERAQLNASIEGYLEALATLKGEEAQS